MSAGLNPSDHGDHHDPEFRVGRGQPARRRIAAFAVGIIVIVFAVLLSIWLFGRSAADAQSTAGVGSVAHHRVTAELAGAAQNVVGSASGGDQAT